MTSTPSKCDRWGGFFGRGGFFFGVFSYLVDRGRSDGPSGGTPSDRGRSEALGGGSVRQGSLGWALREGLRSTGVAGGHRGVLRSTEVARIGPRGDLRTTGVAQRSSGEPPFDRGRSDWPWGPPAREGSPNASQRLSEPPRHSLRFSEPASSSQRLPMALRVSQDFQKLTEAPRVIHLP